MNLRYETGRKLLRLSVDRDGSVDRIGFVKRDWASWSLFD